MIYTGRVYVVLLRQAFSEVFGKSCHISADFVDNLVGIVRFSIYSINKKPFLSI